MQGFSEQSSISGNLKFIIKMLFMYVLHQRKLSLSNNLHSKRILQKQKKVLHLPILQLSDVYPSSQIHLTSFPFNSKHSPCPLQVDFWQPVPVTKH